MRVNAVTNQNFEGNRFRLPINQIQTKWWTKKVDCLKEFENPKAEELYKKAQQTSDLKEKADLLAQMGHYRITDNKKESIISKFLQRILP